jgi:hypothetical protein
MEYLGLLPLGAAIIGLGLRSYLSMTKAEVEQAEETHHGRSSAKAKHAMEKAIVRRFLRYHKGLAQV